MIDNCRFYKGCWIEIFASFDSTYTAFIELPDCSGCVNVVPKPSFDAAVLAAKAWIDVHLD